MYANKKVTFTDAADPISCKTAESARLRNTKLIKELEVSKARLRSRATYSPLEQELSKAIVNYEQNKSLVPVATTKKTYGPTFVWISNLHINLILAEKYSRVIIFVRRERRLTLIAEAKLHLGINGHFRTEITEKSPIFPFYFSRITVNQIIIH